MKDALPAGNCPNCNASLKSDYRYCPKCGQKRLSKHDFSFGHFTIHSVLDYFHLDGGFFASLWGLISKPGWLTNRYLEGKRMQFIHPFKMLMFITIIYFLIVSSEKNFSGHNKEKVNIDEKKLEMTNTILLQGKSVSLDSLRLAKEKFGIEKYIDSIDPDAGWLEKKIAYNSVLLALSGYDSIKEKVVHKSSKVVFILIPVLALILKLFYIRRKRLYYDHLIFSLHFHSFFFLMLLIYALIGLFFADLGITMFIFIILIYLFIALFKVYKQSFFKTLLKFFLICFTYLIIAVPLFFILLVTFTMFF